MYIIITLMALLSQPHPVRIADRGVFPAHNPYNAEYRWRVWADLRGDSRQVWFRQSYAEAADCEEELPYYANNAPAGIIILPSGEQVFATRMYCRADDLVV